ncbi:MAG: GTP-binding protein [Candidatus Bathyarchaeota archaeon]|nr:GTP-binding protein [Candidatus Bathyarchaeota archaeon]
MPRFKQIAEIQQFMSQKEQIRNLGIVAHIDHGKTTLADALLAGVGLLSPQMAGTARVLDYLEDEQRRKITIKTANISLLYKAQGNPYIINLVDTPGHVDFTGKVTRALRAIDGVVVVVDAVEEIMAQTEIVTRQALAERVRPVLFINKVDRLITELQLGEAQIEEKLNRIIGGFNDLIELYGEKPFSAQWKVDPAEGSVAFGSALHGWGFTLETAKRKGTKFGDIINAYKKGASQRLGREMPVYDAVFDMAVRNLPNPKQAQSYRVDRIWSGLRQSEVGESIADCNDDKLAVMCVTHVQPDVEGGSVVTSRLFSGTIKEGDLLHCVNALRETVVNKVYVYMGALKEAVGQVSAGNIAVLAVSEILRAGETLVDAEHKAGVVPFEGINYVSEPVVTVAVEPKNPKDIFDLLKSLHKLVTEDPNLAVTVDKETGEYLLSVMGELHLEVALSQLKGISGGLEVTVSAPRIVYRESATKKGAVASASSSNRQNRFTVQVEPDEEAQASQLQVEEAGSVLSIDEHRNVLVNRNVEKEEGLQEVLEAVIGGFEFACGAGPLCAEPMRHVKVNLLDFELSKTQEQRSSTEVMHAVGKAIFGAFLTAKPVLQEPIYKTVITAPTDLAGECSRILETRRGKISAFEQKGLLTVITGYIPVSETFGLSKELRSATSGRAFWQNMLDKWQQVPQKLAPKVIAQVRRRKGLAVDVPDAGRFLEEA